MTTIKPTGGKGRERLEHRLWLEQQMQGWKRHTNMTMHESDVQPMKMSEVLALADDELRSDWENLTLKYTETNRWHQAPNRGLQALQRRRPEPGHHLRRCR